MAHSIHVGPLLRIRVFRENKVRNLIGHASHKNLGVPVAVNFEQLVSCVFLFLLNVGVCRDKTLAFKLVF